MPGSLAVNISIAGTSYNLQAESAVVLYDRGANAIPLPANVDPIFIDLGFFRATINISGVIDETASVEGGVNVPSKVQLEDVVNSWWNNTITIVINGDDSYTGKFKSARFEVTGAKESYWMYQLTFATTKRA